MQNFGSFWDDQPIWCCEDLSFKYLALRWPSFLVPCVCMQSLQSSPLHRPREHIFKQSWRRKHAWWVLMAESTTLLPSYSSYYCIYLHSLNQRHVDSIWKFVSLQHPSSIHLGSRPMLFHWLVSRNQQVQWHHWHTANGWGREAMHLKATNVTGGWIVLY